MTKKKTQKPAQTAAERAADYLKRARGDKGRAMEEAAAHGDREALEVINPAR